MGQCSSDSSSEEQFRLENERNELLTSMKRVIECINGCSDSEIDIIDIEPSRAKMQAAVADPIKVLDRAAVSRNSNKFRVAADDYLLYIATVLPKHTLPADRETARYHLALAKVHTHMGSYSEALDAIHEAETIVKEESCDHFKAALHVAKARVYIGSEHPHLAEKAIDEANGMLDLVLGEGQEGPSGRHPERWHVLDARGAMHCASWNFGLAMQYHQEALVLKSKHMNVAGLREEVRSMHYIASVHVGQAHWREAVVLLEKALEKLLKSSEFGDLHPETAACYLSIARICMREDKAESRGQALDYFSKALYVTIKVNGKHHRETAKLYMYVAHALMLRSDHENGIHYFGKALEIFERNGTSNTPEAAAAYRDLGHSHRSCGNDTTAQQNYDLAIDVYNACKNDENYAHMKEDVLQSLSDTAGAAAMLTEDYPELIDKRIEYLKVQVEAIASVVGDVHSSVASLNATIANVMDAKFAQSGGGPKEVRLSAKYRSKALDVFLELLPVMMEAACVDNDETETSATYEAAVILGTQLNRKLPMSLEQYRKEAQLAVGNVSGRRTSRRLSGSVAPEPKRGFVVKRGHYFTSMRRRYVEVYTGQLIYRTGPGQSIKGSIDNLRGYSCTKDYEKLCIHIDGPLKDLHMFFESATELDGWAIALGKHIKFANHVGAETPGGLGVKSGSSTAVAHFASDQL